MREYNPLLRGKTVVERKAVAKRINHCCEEKPLLLNYHIGNC